MLDVIAIGELLIDFTPAGRSAGGMSSLNAIREELPLT